MLEPNKKDVSWMKRAILLASYGRGKTSPNPCVGAVILDRNGVLISDGNTNDLYHPFEKMIERASMNTKLLPGDYLGSGTVGTGCILELRPENTSGWIKKGDVVRLEVERLGVLENKIV